MAEPVLEMRGVTKRFRISGENSLFGKTFDAVRDVSLSVMPGETFGIVGESGCGKSTLAQLLMCLEVPSEGEILFKGQRVDNLREGRRRSLRPRFQMVFQDSGSSLNPRKRVADILREPMLYHLKKDKKWVDDRVDALMDMVGLPAAMKERYPHEFSGGQRQRICVAKALVMEPKLIVCDEPVSALDVSIQAQLLNLMRRLQRETGVTFFFIAHDLSVVQYMSDRIAVMYLGNVVELADANTLYTHPMHPYTQALLSAVPVPVLQAKKERIVLSGDVPSPMKPPSGCPFHPRCTNCMEKCKAEKPELRDDGNGHLVACHLFQ